MFGIDDATAVAAMPTPEAAGTPGFFTEGNPGLGLAATYVRASWLNSLQLELLNICTAAGITPSKTAYNQILIAMRSNGLIYAIDTGTANALAVTFAPAVASLTDGMVLWVKAKFGNSGATTLNVNGLGATPVVGAGHTALQGGEIVANGRCMLVYNSTLSAFVLIECTGAALQVGPATMSQHAIQFGQATGRWVNRQIVTSTAAYVPFSSRVAYGDVATVGGGGGGGGCQSTNAGQMSAGAGGGGGGWARRRLTIAQMLSQSMTVGAAGTAGALGSGAGGNGGSTSFGALLSATGGAGGTFGAQVTASNVTFQGSGGAGTGSSGDINGAGGIGRYATYSPGGGIGGDGGQSYLGAGAAWSSGTSGGNTAPARGAGGGGGVVQASNATGAQGGAGGAGLITIDEFE